MSQAATPTPDQIAGRAAKIRKGWDEETFRKRCTKNRYYQEPYTIPVVASPKVQIPE